MAHNPGEYEKVKIAQELVGLDSGDQHFVMSAEEDVKERMARDAAVKFNNVLTNIQLKWTTILKMLKKRQRVLLKI